MSCPTKVSVKRTFMSHWLDVALIAFLGCAIVLIHFVWGRSPHNRFFVERDPFLSYPLEKGWEQGEEIPNELLIALILPISMVILLLFQLAAKKLFEAVAPHKVDLHPKALNPFVLSLAYLEAIGFMLLAVEFLKVFAGRKRPNFFALCDYKGYREAVRTGNFTEYFNLTTAGIPGSLEHCRATEREILEAQFSFPSGHSGGIWCAMSFLSFYCLYVLHRYSSKNGMAKSMVTLFLFGTAGIIATTRPRDYWHNFDDIVAGSVIGFAAAGLAFMLNYDESVSRLYNRSTQAVELSETTLMLDREDRQSQTLIPSTTFDAENPTNFRS